MAKLSYKGSGRPCQTVFTGWQRPTYPCPEQAARGSDYCLHCKHVRQREEQRREATIRVTGHA
jgi:hypothetical protein